MRSHAPQRFRQRRSRFCSRRTPFLATASLSVEFSLSSFFAVAQCRTPPPPHILAAAHPPNRWLEVDFRELVDPAVARRQASVGPTPIRTPHSHLAKKSLTQRLRSSPQTVVLFCASNLLGSWSPATRSGRTAWMLSSRTYRMTATVGRMSRRLPVMSTLGSLRNVFLGLHRQTGIRYAQNGLREHEARTATVCSVKRKTSEGKRLAYSAMTPSKSGMRTGTLLRPRRSPSMPARIGGPSPLAPALGWCSTTEGHAVLPGTPKPWPKIKTSLRTSPRTTRTRGFDGRMDSLLTHQIADEVDRKVAELGQEDIPPEVVERIFLDVAKVNKKGRVLGLGMMSQMYTSASGSSTQSSGTSQLHWKACKRLLHYLKGTASQSLHFQLATHLFLSAFSDADLASSVDDRKSSGGFCVFLGPNLVSWSSKKQRVVSRSSTESEYRSFDDAAVEVIWVKSLLAELGFNINPQPVI